MWLTNVRLKKQINGPEDANIHGNLDCDDNVSNIRKKTCQ